MSRSALIPLLRALRHVSDDEAQMIRLALLLLLRALRSIRITLPLHQSARLKATAKNDLLRPLGEGARIS